MRLKKLLLMLVAVAAALSLSACGSSEEGSGGSGGDSGGEEQSQSGETRQETTANESEEASIEPPEDKSLTVTVPEMKNVKNAEMPNVPYTQQAIDSGVAEQALKENAGIHVDGTGYPWQEEANVYLAGHALGYQNTPSWHAFRDIGKLEEGDEIYVEDANGNEYTYEVFRESFNVEPTQVEVIQPQEDRNILSLQSCTLPDYQDRVIVQAELKDVTKA